METTTEKSAKNIFESWADAQKKAFESWNETSEKFQKDVLGGGNKATESAADYFKKWYDSQMAFFYNNVKETGTSNAASTSNPMDMFNNWLSNQMEAGRKMMDMNQDWTKNMNNPSAWVNNMPGMNDEMKKNAEQAMNTYTSWMNTVTSASNDMLKNFGNPNTKEYFSGMFNNADTYMKMFQLWMPMMKAMGEKDFTPEQFRNLFNTTVYKDMMDKMFGFTPDYMKNMFAGMNAPFQEQMNKAMEMNRNWYDGVKNMMGSNMPSFMQDPFNSYLGNYQNMFSQMQNAANPFARMMPNGQGKEQMEKMAELSNRFNVFQVRNAQMQYMIYTTGMKAMETIGQTMYSKIQKGEEVKSFTQLYSEILNTMDKSFVELFETEEYSKIQSELSGMGLRLKKDIEDQMERAFAGLPLVPRSEMDELYKTIHDLKSRIRLMEKQIDGEFETEGETKTEPKASTKKGKNL